MRRAARTLILLACALGGRAQEYTVHRDGLEFNTRTEIVRLQVCDSGTVRVTVGPLSGLSFRQSLSVTTKFAPVRWSHHASGSAVVLSAPRIRVTFDARTGSLAFHDRRGRLLLKEAPRSPRELTPAEVVLVRGGRRDRLLRLRLRRPGRGDRRSSGGDRACAHVAPVGVRVLAVEGAL